MDNFCIEIIHDSDSVLEHALAICLTEFGNTPTNKVTHYLGYKGELILFHMDPGDEFRKPKYGDGVQRFPTPLGLGALLVMVKEWLAGQPDDSFVESIDCDGSIKRGFRIHNGEKPWGHILGSCVSVCAVQPHWTWYGK